MPELKLTENENLHIYDLVESCDACSFLFCQESLQPKKRKLEISTGLDKKIYSLSQAGDQKITLNPGHVTSITLR